MYYLKPAWLTHHEGQKRFEVYSVDVHPDGTRIASGGLDAKVRIWSTAAIFSCAKSDGTDGEVNGGVKVPSDYTGPKQLCSMSTHSGAVTTVRFSPSGRYLASGSDDRVILVWERDEEAHDVPRKEFGAQGEADTERWVVRRRCVGHDNDVQDLAWSPDSSIMVSVGLDSGVIIWSGTTFEKIKRLDIHQSHVKGITFDPANKYFATASDDRTIKIVRYHRTASNDLLFSIDTTVTAPFSGSPLTTYFRRCSWSPDGSHIAAANATNGPVATVAIINRGVWDSEINLIGHEGPVEVAAFSPRMFAKVKGSKQLVTVIACAGQDKALSVWNTSNPRPIVVSQDVAEKAITDLAWGPDGQTLFASSLDGSIAVCMFEEGDLGYIISKEENEKQLAKYGGGRDAMYYPESVEQLALEEKSAKSTAADTNGKKRIEDIMGETVSTSLTTVSSKPEVPASTVTSTSIAVTTAEPSPQVSEPPASVSTSIVPVSSSVKAEPEKLRAQKVTITKEGRKRVAPMLISGSGASAAVSNSSIVTASSGSRQMMVPVGTVNQYDEPSNNLPPGGIRSLVVGNKRKLQDGEESEPDAKRAAGEVEAPEFIRPSAIAPSIAVSQVRLAVPKVKTVLSVEDGALFEVRNGNGGEKEPTRIALQRKGQLLWSNYLPKMALLAAGSPLFWAVACEDASIHVYSPTGRALVPTIVVESTPCFFDCAGKYLMCLTSSGLVYTWNIQSKKAVHAPVSVAPILDAATYGDDTLHKAPAITKCTLRPNGSLIVTLTNGQGYTYSTEMGVWHRISESWWAVASQYWDSSGMGRAGAGGAVNTIERRTDEEVKRAGKGRFLQRLVKSAMMREGYEGIQGTVSIAHLENRIEAAVLLGSAEEFKSNMIIYAKKLALEGMSDRLDELFRELYGPLGVVIASSKTSEQPISYASEICGMNKKELLKELIVTIGKERAVQRVTVPYARLLGILEVDMTDE
ncbi:protein HIR1 [Myxozyma melibiosi]|uniref:Protein HIR n=1 Tax=Myxozyma melibiosi TaxID=54550 RepID=A0ABR1F5U3_9ASCO